MEPTEPWVSASDLAEYAYCPRAHYYSTHPDVTGGTGRPGPRARAGVLYHRRTLSTEKRHDEHARLYVGLLLAGIALVAVTVLLLGGP